MIPALLLALVVASPPSDGEGEGVRRLTLAEALQRARQASPRLRQLKALEKAADAARRGARAERLPTVGLSGAYTRNSNVPEFIIEEPGQPPLVVFPNLPNQAWARAEASLPLYTGGRVGANITAAEAQREAAGLDLSAGSADLDLEVAASYWNLLARRESERVLREAIASYEAHLKDATNLFETGMAARNDLLAVQVERDRAELDRLQAEAEAEVENANLVRLVDLPPRTRIEPVPPGSAPGPAEEEDLEGLVAAAVLNRPEVRARRARLTAAEASVRAADAASLPQASLAGRFDYANPNQRIFPLAGIWRETWSVGVGVSWTVFDGGRVSAATARAQAQAEAAQSELQDLEARVRLEVTARAQAVRTARASRQVAARSVEAARENVKVSRDRYQAGVSPSSDLLDAETRLLRAGLDETLATAQLEVARAQLDRAVGR
jgi:outer membrane protein TolC